LLIFVAGGLGTVARYLVGLWARDALGTMFPYGTLIVNVVGCFFIAAITRVALTTDLISPTVRLTLTTGFLGGLTTYSSFNLETTRLLYDRAWYAAIINFGATVLGCFAAGLLGFAIARRVFGS
jgi:CrcB protein